MAQLRGAGGAGCRPAFLLSFTAEAARTCRLCRALSAFGGWSQPVDATLYLKGEMECALMGQGFHRGFTATEKTELWDRWKRGESLKAIGRAFGKPSSSIYFLVAPHGGIRPAERRRSRLALTLAERELSSSVERLHAARWSAARVCGLARLRADALRLCREAVRNDADRDAGDHLAE